MSDLHEHSKIEIENRLVAERAKLSGALEELRGRLSLDTVGTIYWDMVRKAVGA